MANDTFRKLSWDELETWAGSKTLSKGRSYIKKVSELCLTSTGGLLAWVQGTHRYATRVEYENDFIGECSCPVGTDCKHSVAVVLHYLELLKQKKSVPVAEEDDERFDVLENSGGNDWDSDESNDDEDEVVQSPRAGTKNQALQDFLAKQDKAKLESLLLNFAQTHSTIRKSLEDQMQAATGASKDLIKQVKRDVSRLGEFDLDDRYYGRGSASSEVDLKRLLFRLKLLLDGGYFDDLVAMGHEILKKGKRFVEETHDEGEYSGQVQSCMEVVLSALPHSSLSKGEQLIWLVELDLLSDYDLVYIDEELENFGDDKPSSEDWSVLANYLQQQLNKDTGKDFSSKYRRDHISDWLRIALENSGQKGEVLRLLEDEAVKTQSYTRLVEELISHNKLSEADAWIKRGIAATEKDAPGYASQLREQWRTLREKEKNYLQLAAFSSESFFASPSLHSFQNLQDAAKRAKLWGTIEPLARAFLETGKQPKPKELGLPELDLPPQREKRWGSAPFTNVLLDLALAEKKPDEVLHWYDISKKSRTGYRGGYSEHGDERIAEAVKSSHPERAKRIWQEIAENLIAQTSVSSYQSAGQYLRKLKPLMGKDWTPYLAKLREENKRKPRCVEILDNLAGRSILGE